jgi:hypothetical protein
MRTIDPELSDEHGPTEDQMPKFRMGFAAIIVVVATLMAATGVHADDCCKDTCRAADLDCKRNQKADKARCDQAAADGLAQCQIEVSSSECECGPSFKDCLKTTADIIKECEVLVKRDLKACKQALPHGCSAQKEGCLATCGDCLRDGDQCGSDSECCSGHCLVAFVGEICVE